jgi:isoleucyl-tRNA synthetase
MDYFPKPEDLTAGFRSKEREVAAGWEKLVPIRERVMKALDVAREEKVIGSSLEASVHLEAGEEQFLLLERFRDELPMWFITSDVTVALGQTQELEARVERARGDRCERCWRYTTDVGSNSDFPTVCARCAAVLPAFVK